jgi:hypothetical protein
MARAASAGDGGWEGWDGSVGGVVVGGWVGGSIRGVGMVLGPLMERCASGRGAWPWVCAGRMLV